MFRRALPLVASTLLFAGVVAAQSPSPDPVATAMAAGASTTNLEGYRIGKRATLVRSAVAVEVGRAYTPHLRIALAARNARDTYRQFSTSDVTPEMTEPVVLIVVPPQPSREQGQEVSVERVIAIPKGEKDPAKAIQPTWSKPNDVSYQNIFGAVWTSTGQIAAFPLSVLDGKHEIVAIYAGRPTMGSGPSGLEIRGELIDRQWK